MSTKKWTAESGLYAVILLLTLTVRLLHLGKNPLSDAEAELALKALAFANGQSTGVGAQALYVLFTGGLFYVFQTTNFLARLLPALAGSLLVGVPYLLREQLGRKTALLLTFFLAISPGLVAASRQADTLILASAFLLLAGAFFVRRKAALGGSMAALALLSGPEIWPGLIALALALGYLRLVKQRGTDETLLVLAGEEHAQEFGWKKFLGWFAGSFVLLGLLFFIKPGGIGAAAGSLPMYLQGWVSGSGSTFQRMLVALLAYEGLALVFGSWAGLTQFRNREQLDRFLCVWSTAALLMVLIYPGRQEIDLVWVLIPLLGMAARLLGRQAHVEQEVRWIAYALAVAVMVLGILVWMNLAGLSGPILSSVDLQLRWVRLAATLVVMALLVVLVGWGWSAPAAKVGFVLGLGGCLLLYTFSASWHAAGLGPHPEAELWRTGPYPAQADLLLKTVGDLSAQQTGERTGPGTVVMQLDSPSLRWLLRDQSQVQFVNFLPAEEQPLLVITGQKDNPGLTAGYSGQDFVWQEMPAWSILLGDDWLGWLTFREVVLQEERIILWTKSDLFPSNGEDAGN
jgi:hypothetical protein